MSPDIRIDFDNNPNGIYYAGQLLSGTVRLTLREEKKVRGVYIRIYGKGYCEWTTGGKIKTTHIGEEHYLNETTYFIGSPDGNVKIPPGTHSYNFQCNLPNDLPTSVEGSIGYIRYTARVTMDIPMGFDKELKQWFTVIRPLNLNDNRALRNPVTSGNSKMNCCSAFCCCFCIWMNPTEVAAQIPVGAYTPGQIIMCQLHVTHKGSPKNYEISVKLMKRIDYFADIIECCDCCENFFNLHRPHNKETECITEEEVSCRISNTTSVEVVCVNLQVPPVPPTDFNSSNVVKVTYYLKITTSTGCCNGNPRNKIPITIGSYPIDDLFALNPNAVDHPTAPLLGWASGTSSFDKQLPTYEGAMDTVDGGGGGGDGDTFKPKYPVFKRTTSYSSGY